MTGVEDFMRRQNEMIDRVGWSVTLVNADPDDSVAIAYTVGLTANGYPELMVAGLALAIAHQLLNDLAARVYNRAERFTHGQRISDLIADYDAVIVDGAPTDQLHPGAAIARYGPQQVRLQQIVWPDPLGRFPWDDGYAYSPAMQPVIGCPDSHARRRATDGD